MFAVLTSLPGVKEARLGTIQRDGVSLPFLEYRAEERSKWVQPTRFVVDGSPGEYMFFQAMLPGAAPIDSHVTHAILKAWKRKCGVLATVLYQ
jgi:hypothetical protein